MPIIMLLFIIAPNNAAVIIAGTSSGVATAYASNTKATAKTTPPASVATAPSEAEAHLTEVKGIS